jgi:hypothetical protein
VAALKKPIKTLRQFCLMTNVNDRMYDAAKRCLSSLHRR